MITVGITRLAPAINPPMTFLAAAAASNSLIRNALPKTSLLLLAASSAASSSTSLFQQKRPVTQISSSDENNTNKATMSSFTPRAKSCVYMATAMALHFGGYEFARSGALALFTSKNIGFSHPAAHPFAIGLVTPVSLSLLYWYGLILRSNGPRRALKTTTMGAIAVLTLCAALLKAFETAAVSSSVSSLGVSASTTAIVSKVLVAILFVFQNSYAHLLYTQQWSFLGSVMTPSEGTKWFSAIAGLSSLICTITATLVHQLAPVVGLLGLVFGTSLTLTASLLFADRAYELSEMNDFDPTPEMQRKHSDKEAKKKQQQQQQQQNQNKANDNESDSNQLQTSSSLLSKTAHLFQRVPTLAALFCEVISFQSLSTVLNICFVRKLQESMPSDTSRASFTGRFYAFINGSSGLLQFFVLPLARKYLEPRGVYKSMPLLLVPFLAYATFQSSWATSTTTATTATSGLWMTAAAFFALKTLDYSLRNVVNEMVYQPLDFDSRYLGKEVIGVFANRFGKSGMSILLSLLTAQFPGAIGVPQLSQLSLAVAGLWTGCSFWLSRTVVSNQEAERRVQERQEKNKTH